MADDADGFVGRYLASVICGRRHQVRRGSLRTTFSSMEDKWE